jgi:hypothetical protein
MDINTILILIDTLDAKLQHIEKTCLDEVSKRNTWKYEHDLGGYTYLEDFKEDLQSLIELEKISKNPQL